MKSGARREAISAAELDEKRVIAQEAGCTFYMGAVCEKDPAHGTMRYTNTGRCVECNRAFQRSIQKEKYAKRKAGVKDPNKSERILQSDPNAFTYVAFSLASVEAIAKWRESVMRKLGGAA